MYFSHIYSGKLSHISTPISTYSHTLQTAADSLLILLPTHTQTTHTNIKILSTTYAKTHMRPTIKSHKHAHTHTDHLHVPLFQKALGFCHSTFDNLKNVTTIRLLAIFFLFLALSFFPLDLSAQGYMQNIK